MASHFQHPLRAKALIFDMDGTLLLSAAVFERIWRQWGEENGMDGEAIIAVAHGRRMIDTVREVCPPGLDPDAVAAELSRQEREDVEGIVAIAGVEPFLASIPADRWAIVTSADLDLCRIRLKAAGITPPDVLITAEDVTKGKPDPQGYIEAARRLGVAPADAIVFEDAPAGIAAGKAAGSPVLVIASMLKPETLGEENWSLDYTGLSVSVGADGDLTIEANTPRVA